MTMTENEFYQKALLSIASNHAFGNGEFSYIDYGRWAKRIHDAADALTDIALKNSHFDEDDYEPP